MGLTKQYLRFVPGPIFGVVASSTANILFVKFRGKSLIAVPACENILISNYRTNECVYVFKGDKHSVTCLVNDFVRNTLAVGYADGAIRVFSLINGELLVVFNGHKSSVSCLAYDEGSLRLASGGKDTEVVLWDLVGETGLFRLKGHKGPVTNSYFFLNHNVLITSSEDTLLKFWNLDSQHCFKTLVGNRGEIWDFVILNDTRLITGINDSDLRVWDLNFRSVMQELDDHHGSDDLTLVEVGTILTTGEKKTVSMGVDNHARILACHGHSKTLLLFKLLNQEESLKKFRKRKRKELKRSGDTQPVDSSNSITLSDQIVRLKPLQATAKILKFHIVTDESGLSKIALLLNDNSFSIFTMNISDNAAEAALLHTVSSGGHRSYVNTLAFSSDSLTMLSASNDSVKIWNQESQRCIHTFECEGAVSSLFATGNDYFLIGTHRGHLKLFELSSHKLVESLEAHDGPVSAIAASSDQRNIISGGGDKDVKFWEYELIKDDSYSGTKKRLSLTHVKTLKMSEEILCLKYSPNIKFFAVSLLDCTVKVFFCDTLKFAFSLYGHKLPITCMDISYDSSLLVTGSRDRNMKIWSLEFGNCLKSIFAHEESIVALQFLPKTHMIFSAGRDKKVKQWDCDNFQKIVTLEGHQAVVLALGVSPDGTCVVTASKDRSLRFWEKTDEPLVLEEEQENEREQEMDQQLASKEPVITGESSTDVGLASRATTEALKSVEQLIEAIDIFKIEMLALEDYRLECERAGKKLPPPTQNAFMIAYNTTCPYEFMLKILRKARSSNLEEALLHLPFNYVVDFLKIISEFVKRKWEMELSTRCVLFLVRAFLGQITLCQELFPVIETLKVSLLDGLAEMKDTVGFNLAGLKFVQRQIDASDDVTLFKDAAQKMKRRSRKRNLITFL